MNLFANPLITSATGLPPTSAADIRYRREGSRGEPDGPMKYVGEDRRMSVQRMSKAYQQLGSFLHVPTIKQMRQSKPVDIQTIRNRAETIREELKHVLSATLWNSNFSVSVTITCANCDAPIKRSSDVLDKETEVECGNCGQFHDVEPQPDGSYKFVPASFSWECKACDAPRTIIQAKAKEGLDVSCPSCGDRAYLTQRTRWNLVRDSEQVIEPASQPPQE